MSGMRPSTENCAAEAAAVKSVMVVVVAMPCTGMRPRPNSSGPRTMPPPMPRNPATKPALVPISGYLFKSINNKKTKGKKKKDIN